MTFSTKIKAEALARSGRHCCLCYKKVGINVEVHHIVQEADGGPNTLDNAITLCFDCHADIGHYNVRHPRGNKYTPEELRRRRDGWWRWFATNPGKPLPHDAIRITPRLIHFWSSGGRHTNVLYVHNTSTEIFYSIIILLKAEPVGFSLQDVRVEAMESNKEPMLYDLDGIELTIDNITWDSNEGKTIVITSLEPDERRKYRITHVIPYNIGIVVQPKATTEVISASFEPIQVLKPI